MERHIQKRTVRSEALGILGWTIVYAFLGYSVGRISTDTYEAAVFGDENVQMKTYDLELKGAICGAQLETSHMGGKLPERCSELDPLFQTTIGSDIYVYESDIFEENLAAELSARHKNDRDTEQICMGSAALIGLVLCTDRTMSRRRPED